MDLATAFAQASNALDPFARSVLRLDAATTRQFRAEWFQQAIFYRLDEATSRQFRAEAIQLAMFYRLDAATQSQFRREDLATTRQFRRDTEEATRRQFLREGPLPPA